jgi:hypothetical protein
MSIAPDLAAALPTAGTQPALDAHPEEGGAARPGAPFAADADAALGLRPANGARWRELR